MIKVVPEENQRRFYALRTLPTLFGDYALQREWPSDLMAAGQRHTAERQERLQQSPIKCATAFDASKS